MHEGFRLAPSKDDADLDHTVAIRPCAPNAGLLRRLKMFKTAGGTKSLRPPSPGGGRVAAGGGVAVSRAANEAFSDDELEEDDVEAARQEASAHLDKWKSDATSWRACRAAL